MIAAKNLTRRVTNTKVIKIRTQASSHRIAHTETILSLPFFKINETTDLIYFIQFFPIR